MQFINNKRILQFLKNDNNCNSKTKILKENTSNFSIIKVINLKVDRRRRML